MGRERPADQHKSKKEKMAEKKEKKAAQFNATHGKPLLQKGGGGGTSGRKFEATSRPRGQGRGQRELVTHAY
ncbi:hypothetical protein CI109_105655 [Kwoniella shandongensis]|uniref:Uncharacterized protein n=1 Tax=Kwoniella shandongensis TaxID=1734106 RepID=A0AAJ8LPY0_9TREE